MKIFKTSWISALMNIIGLGIAFAVFLILMSQVWWDYRYDRFKGGKDVYMVENLSAFDGKYSPMVTRPAVQKIKDCSPDIEAACDFFGRKGDQLGIIQIKGKSGEYERVKGINYGITETSVIDVFNIILLAGRKEDFAAAGDALVSESAAELYFPGRNPIGEIFYNNFGRSECRIVGIYKDRKENETMVNGILIHEGDTDLEFPNYNPHMCYVKLAPGADISSVSNAVKNVKVHSEDTEYRITKLHSHWFMWDTDLFGDKTGGNKLMCYILLVIAILFLAIAAFNYINFAMASIPFRIKDINTRKVYGATRRSLILRQLLLAFGIVGAAFLFGVLTMRTLSGTSWATFLSGSMAPGKNIPVILIGGAVAVVVALVSGLIPAYYSTSFQPALVLKGAFSMTAKGGGLRTVTLILQYVLSFIFIISALVLQRQTNFMARNNDLGFDYDLVLKMDSKMFSPVKEVADEIRKIPGVIDVTRGESPIQDNPSSRSQIRNEDNDNVVQFSFRDVPPEYPEFFHLELVEGRMPLPGENGVALVNESFVESLPSYGVGKTIYRFNEEATIIGVLKDFHARTFQHTYSPLVLFVGDKWNFNSFMIRVRKDADVSGILAKSSQIYGSIRNLDESDIETGFLNKDIEKLYEQEIRQTRLIKMSSLLSLIIALIGILGLVWFDTRYMRKEVAIRKVNGASSKDILTKINLKYILIAGVSFVIATPLAYAIAQRWMSQFAFRTNIPAWLFAVAFVVVLLITLAVVTLQSWNTANANPVDSLKNE